MCGYFCIGFIIPMIKDKILIGFANLFFMHNVKKNNEVVFSYLLK